MSSDDDLRSAAVAGRRFFVSVGKRDADAAAEHVTPESRERWGDFAEFFDEIHGLNRPIVATEADHVVDAQDVAYVKLLEHVDGGRHIEIVGVLTLVWRPEFDRWLVHDFGAQVPARDAPRTSPGEAPGVPEESRPWVQGETPGE